MYRVYYYDPYENPQNKDVGMIKTQEEAIPMMNEYINEFHNDVKIYYWRYWGSNETGWTYDYGSHVRFFKLEYVEDN